LATAFASIVLPVPGGPYINTPLGGSIPINEKIIYLFIDTNQIKSKVIQQLPSFLASKHQVLRYQHKLRRVFLLNYNVKYQSFTSFK
jgi:hypothetical protein